MPQRPTIEDIRDAHERIKPHAHRTPVLTCRALDERFGCKLFFKCENFQQGGAFKFRGALNTVLSLTEDEAARGVATHSSGNHAAALALAAGIRGIPAYIVMPCNSPAVKQAAVAGYGGKITLCEPNLAARESTCARVMAETGATLVHPYDDPRIIAGQGTCAVELHEEVPDLDVLLVPCGGGGLLSGSLLATRAVRPACRVMGCEPAEADDAYRSHQAGKLIPAEQTTTIADGLRTSLGEHTFPIIHDLVEQIALASEDGIRTALRLVIERMKILVEPSAVVPLAALLENDLDLAGRRVGLILSGGNVDLEKLPGLLK